MILKKWNYKKHVYEDYNVPNEWKVGTVFFRDTEEINCPHCGKKILYKDSFTSMEVHTEVGFGYCICEECHNEEWERRKEANSY